MWVVIRVPYQAVERAIRALKESMTRKHSIAHHTSNEKSHQTLRDEADADYEAAEHLQRALREQSEDRGDDHD